MDAHLTSADIPETSPVNLVLRRRCPLARASLWNSASSGSRGYLDAASDDERCELGARVEKLSVCLIFLDL